MEMLVIIHFRVIYVKFLDVRVNKTLILSVIFMGVKLCVSF
jgi:hypothetical protein